MPCDLGGFVVFFHQPISKLGARTQCKDLGGLLKISLFFVPVVYGCFSFETQCSIF